MDSVQTLQNEREWWVKPPPPPQKIPETSTTDTFTLPTSDLGKTLKEREGRYGNYAGTALLAQTLKETMRDSDNWRGRLLTYSQRESLDMIANKLARILNGDPDYADSWHDVAGYAKLIEKQLRGEEV